MLPSNDPESLTSVGGHQVDDTAEKQHGDNSKPKNLAENYGDPSDMLWSTCLNKSKDLDDEMIKQWTRNMDDVLVFTGLFSAIVAAFIMESYKKLSPDSGDQTVALLTQLVNISTGVPVIVQTSPPFKAPASIVRVNVMWVLSLILSLSCALLAALVLQSARLYHEYAHVTSGSLRERALVRAYMLNGTTEFWMDQVVQATHFLLHTSIFLFFAGLIDFLLPINKAVAFSALGCIVVVVSIYATSTLLPILRPNFPYRTPLSGFIYSLFQFSALGLFLTAQGTERIFRGLLLKIRQRSHPNVRSPNDMPTKWRMTLEKKVSTHRARFLFGLSWPIVSSAFDAPPSVHTRALNLTLISLDDREFEDFVVRMPGFFDSRADSDVTSVMLSLMSDQSMTVTILGARLRTLLDTCSPGTPFLSVEQRTNRLRTCLKSLWYFVRAYNQSENSGVPLAPYFRDNFASPKLIGSIQTEQDLAIRLLGRCFWSLVARKLAIDLTQPNRDDTADTTAELACLSSILGATDEQVKDWLRDKGAIDLANVIWFTSGVVEMSVANGAEGVPTDVEDKLWSTSWVLEDSFISSHGNVERYTGDLPSGRVWFQERFHEIYSRLAYAQIPVKVKASVGYILEKSAPFAGVTLTQD